MPTLHRVAVEVNSGQEETAPASDVAWITKQLMEDRGDSFNPLNDSTWSSTNLESALDDLRQIAQARRDTATEEPENIPPEKTSQSPLSGSVLHSTTTSPASEHNSSHAAKRSYLDDESVTMDESQIFKSKKEDSPSISQEEGGSNQASVTMDVSRCLLSPDVTVESDSTKAEGSFLLASPPPAIMADTNNERMNATLSSPILSNNNNNASTFHASPASPGLSPIPNLTPFVPRTLAQTKGPNQMRFEQDFTNLHDKIRSYQRSRATYREMNTAEQERAQTKVVQLLNRLEITSSKPSSSSRAVRANNTSPDQHKNSLEQSLSQDRTMDVTMHPQSLHGVGEPASPTESKIWHSPTEQSVSLATHNQSMCLLTPRSQSEAVLTPKSSPHGAAASQRSPPLPRQSENDSPESNNFPPIDDNSIASSSVDSIEIARSMKHSCRTPSSRVRQASDHDSPHGSKWAEKRMATSSGKRGLDASRQRTDDGCLPASNELVDTVRRLSMCAPTFSSQSPITLRGTYPSSSEDEFEDIPQPDVSFGDSLDDNIGQHNLGAKNRLTDSIHDSIASARRVHWGESDSSRNNNNNRLPLGHVSGNVGLKAGSIFHLEPLVMERRPRQKELPTRSFPDPFEGLSSRVARRMKRIYKWTYGRDVDECPRPSIVLSVPSNFAQLLILRLLLEGQPIDHSEPSQDLCDGGQPRGETLIVARDKDALDGWGHLFREGSAFSVLNHTTLPQAERKSRHTSHNLRRYDVVLTTFDALKATDVTVSLDDQGWSTNRSEESGNGGWFASRSSQSVPVANMPVKNKQLSVLHQIHWRRVVFIDETGRKSFLVKPNTNRAMAAIALNAESRISFFPGPTESSAGALATLLNGDKRAALSLGLVLRVEEKRVEEEILFGRSAIDFRDR